MFDERTSAGDDSTSVMTTAVPKRSCLNSSKSGFTVRRGCTGNAVRLKAGAHAVTGERSAEAARDSGNGRFWRWSGGSRFGAESAGGAAGSLRRMIDLEGSSRQARDATRDHGHQQRTAPRSREEAVG
jgi:hypothetical protein